MEKKLPMRMCIVCKNMVDKRDMLRIVKTPEGKIMLDSTGKMNGRGAYVCNNDECMKKLEKSKGLNKSFKTGITGDIYSEIAREYERIKNN